MNDLDPQVSTTLKKPRGKPIPLRKERKRRPRRMRVAISPRVRFAVLERDRFMCRYCGAKSPEVALQIDHIIAVANGGSNTHENLVAACFSCNLGKSDKPLSTAGLMHTGLLEDIKSLPAQVCDPDSNAFLECLGFQEIRLNAGSDRSVFSVNEIVKAISGRGNDAAPVAHAGQSALARIGIKVDAEQIAIANRSRDLALLLHGTKWEGDWRKPLRMVNGSTASRKPIYFAPGLFSRATIIPIAAFWTSPT